MTARMPLSDGSVAVVEPHGAHVLVSREVEGSVVWGQALAVRANHPDEVALLADWLDHMQADPPAFSRWQDAS